MKCFLQFKAWLAVPFNSGFFRYPQTMHGFPLFALSCTICIYTAYHTFPQSFILLFYSGRSDWEKILDKVNCEIISVTKNDSLDSYVLRLVVVADWRRAGTGMGT